MWLTKRFKEQYAEKEAIIFNNQAFSYKELDNRITDYKSQLDSHVKEGEVVAIISDYSFEGIALFFALTLKNTIVVPIASTVQEEVDDRLEEANVEVILSFVHNKLDIKKRSATEKHQFIQNLNSLNHPGLILFSSGSTGKPKAMIHDLENLIDSYQERKNKSLTFLILLMFDHIGGLNTLFNCLSMGVKIVLPQQRTVDEVCSLIETESVNILPASPTFLNLILMGEGHIKYNLSSLRLITYGTEPMPESLLVRLKDNFGRVKFLQTFGTSETGISPTKSKSSVSTFIKLGDSDSQYKIVDGELWLKSKTQILGYLNASMERFTPDGWFKTGDIVEQSDDGYLKIVGRNSEVINVGGEKVLPSEIESVLLSHEEIADCIVYAAKNSITGQSVVAKIVPADSNFEKRELKKEIKRFCKTKLDKYKIPTKLIFVDKTNFGDRFKKKRINQ